MNFDLFFSPAFIEIVKQVYALKGIQLPLERCPTGEFPLLVSRLPLKSKLGFNLPFGFYQTSAGIQKFVDENNWTDICKYSKLADLNISLASVGELPFGNGTHFANNPILGLNEVVDPFDRYTRNHRQNIRTERNKSSRLDVRISFSESKSDLLQFYDVMAKQYVKDHMMVFQPFDLFSSFSLSGLGKLLVAKHGDEVLGGMFCLFDGEVFHYSWGVRKKFQNLNIGTLLIDYAVNYAHSNGFKYFDFGSTPLSDDDLYQFKMKWGCMNYCVYKYFTNNKVPQVDLNNSFSIARRLYSKISPKLAQRLMPFIVPWLVS